MAWAKGCSGLGVRAKTERQRMKNQNAILALRIIDTRRSLVVFQARPAPSNPVPRSRQLAVTFEPAPKAEIALRSAFDFAKSDAGVSPPHQLRNWGINE